MANQTITLKSQRLNVLGPTPTQQWGASNAWNTMKWGVNTWGIKSAGTGGVPPMIFSVGKVWSKAQTLTLSDTVSRTPNKVSNHSLAASSTISTDNNDGKGYHYIYTTSTSYSQVTSNTSGYTQLAASGSVTWSSL